MSIAASPQSFGGRIVLDGVSWDLYEHLLAEIGERPIRLTFDQGRLEITTLSHQHERVKTVIGRLIEAYGDAMDLDVRAWVRPRSAARICKRDWSLTSATM